MASVTTDISPWIPCALGFGAIILCLVLVLSMPDTRKNKRTTYHRVASDEALVESPANEEVHDPSKSTNNFSVDGLRSAFFNRNILLVIPVFLVGIYRYTTLNILIQYASVRFKIRISTGATFYTETAIVNIFLFLFLIPRTTNYIRITYKTRPEVIDLFLVRLSVSLLSIGALFIGLSPTSHILPIGE